MSAVPITRRALARAAGAVLGAAALPAGISRALAADLPPVTPAETAPAVFDAAAFVADVRAAGFEIAPTWEPPQPSWELGRPAYCIGPSALGSFGGRPYRAVMARWSDAMDTCPDHVERVVAHLVEQARRS